MAKTSHIVVIPSAGFSHLFPIIEFSKRLLHHHPDFHVTCIIPSLDSPPPSSIAYLQSLPSNIHSIFLPPIPKNNLSHQSHLLVSQIQLTVTLSLPYIREELNSLSSKHSISALVVDLFALEALDFATELNILSYVYLPLSAMVSSFYIYISWLDESFSTEFRDLKDPIFIPNCCVPIHGSDLPDSFQDRSSPDYKQNLERCIRLRQADGILFNSFSEFESETIIAMQKVFKGKNSKPQIYPVGPIIQSGSSIQKNGFDQLDCLKWLNNQKERSVVYVSFGSGGTLSQEQLNELAFGLEQSGKKFLWVVRAPSQILSDSYLGTTKKEDPLDFLPKGFLERTKDKGFVVASWAPQISILRHCSIGGFISHCGWNSVLESVVNGVPMITWPLFAEQRMNAVLLTNGLKVALRPKANQRGIVEREEIAKVIIRLMESEEGKQVCKRMEDFKYAAANALKEDGSSSKALSQFAMNLRMK